MSAHGTSSAKATLGWPFSFALNQLLESQPWAKERLVPFAGEALELRAPLLPALRFVVLPGGSLQAASDEIAPSLVLRISPASVLALMRGEEHVARSIEVSGDPHFASEVRALVRHLRWDAEEDLARVFGDVLAHRIAGFARSFAAWQRDAARRAAESLSDYAIEETRALLGTREGAAFAARVAALRDAIERLEKRIEHLG